MMISYPKWTDWWGVLSESPLLRETLGRPEVSLWKQARFLASARPSQRPPKLARNGGNDWRTWLFMGGRGAGKTRAGAEFVRFAALYEGARRIALIGPTFADVRDVMVEGHSGLLALEYGRDAQPMWQPSRGRLLFSSGA